MSVDVNPKPSSIGELSPVALLRVDGRRRVDEANSAAEILLKLSRRSINGKQLSELAYHDSPLFELLDRADQTIGDIVAFATPLSGPSLPPRLLVDITVRRLEAGGFIIALTESVVREKAETQAGVAGFGRILGHEVKNPLGGIIGAAQLLERQGVEDQSELLDIIKNEARRIERLVNRLSAFELFSAPRFEAINIHEVLERVLASEAAAIGDRIKFIRVFDPSLPLVLGDADHLQQAFQNIVRNAVEAAVDADEPGQVTVSTAYIAGLSMKKARLGAGLRKAMLVSIEDNGRGIPRDRLNGIFDVFQSSKSGARGLGLSIVNEVIGAHGGQIRVESEPSITRFTVLLPFGDGDDGDS